MASGDARSSARQRLRRAALHCGALLLCASLLFASALAQSQDLPSNAPPAPIVQRGTGAFTTPPPPAETETPPPSPIGPPIDIVFERAPIALVAQSLIADYAGASVIIDPRTSGEITIRSRGQLTANQIPHFLRAAVAPLGLELIEQTPNAYLLRPRAAASDPNAAAQVYQPGAQTHGGVVIFGLRHVSASAMARLVQSFARSGVTIQPETTRELLILTGAPDQIDSLVRTIELLDVDWLDGMSFGIAPLTYSDPERVVEELRALFGGADGPIGAMVEFVPLPSRRAVLILAKRPERLDQAQVWIQQLDRPSARGAGRIQLITLENADVERVLETVTPLFSGDSATTRLSADAARNALIVQSDPATFEDIRTLVAQLDAPVDQVVIETTIAEVTLNNDFRFGVQWSFDLRDGGRVTLTEGNSSGVVGRFPGFSYGYQGNYVQAALNVLSSRTQVEVISSPVVVTLDNQEAVLQVGDEVPIVTQSATNLTAGEAAVVNSVQYRETGILLRVTPRIGAGGTVTLDVKQEASEVASTTTSGIDSPTIQQRRFESTVSIADGETVALGGLIRATRTRSRAGVPLLSSVPVLGAAFRNSSTDVRRTELLVFMTPRIIRTREQAAAATDDLEARLNRVRRSSFIQRYAPAAD